uniref:Testis expressed basic protein 1 n=1 Tax=Rousettus aegyptiacus TaxID=9407 RepID=A0A7J8KJ32_ROUAE|nr:testis expressed basic protein 1 [Rousettus aegyptiacus]
MAVLEITLAVILTLLGLAILAILLTRWTRRKQNEIDVSRYNSEQSAGLLDYEDGKGFRHSYSTESDTSYDDREGSTGDYTPSVNSLALSQSSVVLLQGSVSNTKNLKAIPEPLPSTAGAIMQFTAPIPGATGPIKLSQKTIVQTPGPIVQYTGSTAGPPPVPSGVPLAPIMISQRTSIDSSGKIVLSPVVIFPGYMDGELAKKSVPKALIVKSGTTKSRSSQEENKETLKKEILFRDSHESLTSMHKTGSKSKAKGIELEKGQIGMEVKVKESDTRILKTQEAQVKKSKTGIPQEQEAQVEKSEARISQEQEAHVEETETGIPQGQEAQVERSESGIPQGPEAQAERSESGIQGQKAQVKKSEAGLPQGQEVQVKKENSEDKREQDREKGDAKKNKDTKQNDAKNKKDDEVKDKVKGKKEPEAKGKKCLKSKDTSVHHPEA